LNPVIFEILNPVVFEIFGNQPSLAQTTNKNTLSKAKRWDSVQTMIRESASKRWVAKYGSSHPSRLYSTEEVSGDAEEEKCTSKTPWLM
jgi:hypothetical protein